MGVQNRIVNFEDAMAVGKPSQTGFEEVQKGVFLAVQAQDGFHLLSTPIALAPDAYYRVQYDVRRLPREKVIFTADFYAPGYDNPEQELTRIIGMNVLGQHQNVIFNSGNSPLGAHLRLFYTGLPGLELANIQVTREPTSWVWLKRGLLAVVFGALLFIIVPVLRQFLNPPPLLSKSLEVGKSKVMAAEVLTVVTVYLCAVLVRYIMYIIVPYWSGDEYAYKSIAAGIWHFGKNGLLTDTMVAHSVDLPNLLYPYLISPAFILEENFYFGIRLINSIVMNAAIFPCYLIARKYLERGAALAAAGISIAIPFLTLGAFAVTEVLFFPLFLLSIWIAIESIERQRSIGWNVAFGLAAAVLLNVRLNALVMLPAYLLSLLWISLRRREVVDVIKRPYWLASLGAFISAHILLQYYLGVKKIGGMGLYSSSMPTGDGPLSVLLKDPAGVFNLVAGHLTTLTIPYALPMAVMVSVLASRRSKMAIDDKFYNFLILAAVFSTALFVLALVFTVSVSPTDLGGLGRWHSRYYFYFYPLMIIAGAVFMKHFRSVKQLSTSAIPVIVVLLLAINIYFIKFHEALQNPWFGSIADNMDVQWYRSAGQFYWFFVLFTLLLAWLWHAGSVHFVRWLACFLVAWLCVSNYGTLRVAGAGAGATADTCGSLSQRFFEHHPGRFVIVGDSRPTMVGAAFWNPYVPERTLLHSNSSEVLGSKEVGVASDYLVVNGDIQVEPTYKPLLSIDKCAIYEVAK